MTLRNQTTLFRTVLSLVLLTCLATFVVSTYRWPLIGDAALMHYLVFLTGHGMAPYRDIVDMNMPGTYLIEAAVSGLAGGALAWRLFDLLLLLTATGSMIAIALPCDWFAGLFGGVLFSLVHAVDGIPHVGQRDFVMAVLLLAAYAALLHAVRTGRPWWCGIFGLFAAMAGSIKPTIAPLLPVLLGMLIYKLVGEQKRVRSYLLWGIVGVSVPVVGCALFLEHFHVWGAYLEVLRELIPYDAQLGRRPVSYLLQHCLSPIQPIVAAGLVVVLLSPRRPTWEEGALLLGAGFALASYLVQGKGYPYHRYPFLALMLLLVSLRLSEALRGGWFSKSVAVCAFVYGSLILAPLSVHKVRTYEWWRDDFQQSLRRDLEELGGSALSGHVQCLDMSAGCIKTLDRMGLVQSTGFLYDFYLLAPEETTYQTQERERFMRLMIESPPRVLVITNQDYLFGDRGFAKIERWPEFSRFLADRYSLQRGSGSFAAVRWEPRSAQQSAYFVFALRR